MPSSKRGGNASVVTRYEGKFGPTSSTKPSRKDAKALGDLELELSTKNKKGSSTSPSTNNRANLVRISNGGTR